MQFPDDADGDAMRKVFDHGSDPDRAMDVDFMIACTSVETGKVIADLAVAKGYAVNVSTDEEDGAVTCYCTKSMLLDYEALKACQAELDQLARPHEGYIDGWGTFGNVSV